VHKAMI